jgi:hypothetical protein
MPTEKAKREALEKAEAGRGTSRANMTSRFVGLIVVPGKHIVKLEVEMKQAEPWEGVMAFRGQAAVTTQSELAEGDHRD